MRAGHGDRSSWFESSDVLHNLEARAGSGGGSLYLRRNVCVMDGLVPSIHANMDHVEFAWMGGSSPP